MDADNPLNNPTTENPLPDPGAMGIKPSAPKKKSPNGAVMFGAAIAVALVLIIGLVAFVVSRNSNNSKQLKAQYDLGYQKGASEQKAKSDAESIATAASDTRVYKAVPELGSFEVPIPKSWSFAVTPKPTDGTFKGVADPDNINLENTTHAFSIELKRSDYDKLVADYDGQTKKIGSDIKGSDITVSGIKGRQYTGTIDSKSKVKSTIVILPYREKVLIFTTNDATKYGSALASLLNGTKLLP